MQIEIFHDTVCPWCRIGKHNLMRAIESWNAEKSEQGGQLLSPDIRFRTYYLDPNIPEEGILFREYADRKFGEGEYAKMTETIQHTAEHVGLTFNFEKVERRPNTTLSHQLIALAPRDKQMDLTDAIYKAYFEDGLDIGSEKVLIGIVEQLGIPATSIKDGLRKQTVARQLGEDLSFAHQAGVTGVPFFVFNGRYAVTGAQPVEVFKQIFTKITEEPQESQSSDHS